MQRKGNSPYFRCKAMWSSSVWPEYVLHTVGARLVKRVQKAETEKQMGHYKYLEKKDVPFQSREHDARNGPG